MKLLRLCAALALACVLATPAIAQDVAPVIAPTTASSFLSIVLGGAAMLLTTILIPLAVLYGQGLLAERKLKNAQLADQLRTAVNGGVQKAVAGELAKIEVPNGKVTGVDRERVIDAAGAVVVKNFSESLAGLGIEDVHQLAKGKEMAATTLGLMDAQAAGNPVPNASQPLAAPATQSVTVTPNKK
jgi:hypothetical protein